jgi:cellulose synthase/poly-beta-1,6-N-acetylglucosamine synthase-like glycosyltransferase
MKFLEIFFWFSLIIVFYTYLGYGIVLYLLVKIKELFLKQKTQEQAENLPEVTLFITAFNEEAVVKEKMDNCLT